MALRYAPPRGTIITVDFDLGFRAPEMVKRRLAVVVSPPIRARGDLLTVVPLSTTAPLRAMPYHCQIDIPFDLPAYWGNRPRWVKGDMVNAVGFHRCDLLALGKSKDGSRIYQLDTLPPVQMDQIIACVLRSLGS